MDRRYSIASQKLAFADARFEIARDLYDSGLTDKLEQLTGQQIACDRDAGNTLAIVAREPYALHPELANDVDTLLTDGYEYGVGIESTGRRSVYRQLFPVFTHLRSGEPIPLQPEIFSAEEAEIVLKCVQKLSRYRQERFPSALKNLKGFLI